VHCSLRGAPVDAVPGVFGRDVVSKIPVLVYFLITPAILLAVASGVPTTPVNLFDDCWGNGCSGARWVVVRFGGDGPGQRRPLHRR